MNKKQLFFENARLLNEAFGIAPLLYGSLGLEYLTGENLNADDIDILIPRRFISENWPELCALLETNGYTLIDVNEHEFEKDGVLYAYAAIDGMEDFAGVPVAEIAEHQNETARFKLLSLEQYLKVYRASAKDGYRVNVREKKDNEKTAFIQNLLDQKD